MNEPVSLNELIHEWILYIFYRMASEWEYICLIFHMAC